MKKKYKYFIVTIVRNSYIKYPEGWKHNSSNKDMFPVRMSTIEDWMDSKTIESRVTSHIMLRFHLPHVETFGNVRLVYDYQVEMVDRKSYEELRKMNNLLTF